MEEDEDQRSTLEQYLGVLRYQVLALADPDDVSRTMAKFAPDVLIMDVNAKGGRGIEILTDVKRQYPGVSVIMMSEDKTSELILYALFEGAEEFLYKPISVSELDLRVRNVVKKLDQKRRIEQLNRQLLREKTLLLKYFSPEIVDKILKEEISPDLNGSNMNVSVLFFDLRNSTGLAENLAPNEFADLLNRTLSAVMRLVVAHHGSVNKLTGDGILATFGLPIPSELDAQNCVGCARSIRSLFNGNAQMLGSNGHRFGGFGVGIATGIVFAGNVGDQDRMEYTVIGDAVNVASRLEQLTKELPCEILADARTVELARVDDAKPMQSVSLRGRRGEVAVFEV